LGFEPTRIIRSRQWLALRACRPAKQQRLSRAEFPGRNRRDKNQSHDPLDTRASVTPALAMMHLAIHAAHCFNRSIRGTDSTFPIRAITKRLGLRYRVQSHQHSQVRFGCAGHKHNSGTTTQSVSPSNVAHPIYLTAADLAAPCNISEATLRRALQNAGAGLLRNARANPSTGRLLGNSNRHLP
jgi:hypothetical protein